MSIELEAIKIHSLDYLGAYVLPQSQLEVTQVIDGSGNEPEDLIAAGSYQVNCFHRVKSDLSFDDKTVDINGELDFSQLDFYATNIELVQSLEASYARYSYFDDKGGDVEREEEKILYLRNQGSNKNINIKAGAELEGVELNTGQQPLRLQVRNNNNDEDAIVDFDLSLYL